MLTSTFLLAFSLTLFAGLATGIGSVFALVVRRVDVRILAAGLGLSAGVMLWISLVEILPTATEYMTEAFGEGRGGWGAIGSFFAGVALILVIDRLVPEPSNPHELPQGDKESIQRMRLMRTGVVTAGAIAIHNFPEGFATFMSTLEDPSLGVAVALAVAIHNIPEGIAVSVPIYYATGSRRAALTYGVLSGLAEPAGGLLGYLIFFPLISPLLLGFVLASVAGVMVFISLDELLPTAREYDTGHISIYGLIAGMAIMAISLQMLG